MHRRLLCNTPRWDFHDRAHVSLQVMARRISFQQRISAIDKEATHKPNFSLILFNSLFKQRHHCSISEA